MVADKVDMSLDDIISSNKRGRGRGGRGGGRGRGSGRSRGFSNNRRGGRGAGGPIRRDSNRGGNRSTPYTRPRNVPDKWEHDMYDGAGSRASGGRRSEGLTTEAHLQISNLDFGVTESDIKELFTEFGKLKKATINYDESGRSHGTADVVFERKPDALKAFNTYNGVPLDGRAMKIEMVTAAVTSLNSTMSSGRRGSSRGFSSNRSGGLRSGGNFQSSRGRSSRGGQRGRGGRGRGRGRDRRQPPSKEDLDKELDSYIEHND